MRTLIIPTSILVLSLGGAWLQFTAEPDKIGDNEVLVMANQSTNISAIDWVSEKQEVHITNKTDALGSYLWVEYIDKKIPDDPQYKYFIAGKNGDRLLESLSPLVGVRKLDETTDLETLGLDTPTATFKVTSNGTTRSFSIGDEVYGTKDLYLRDDTSQELFLVDDSKLRNLRQARTTMPNRALFAKETNEASSATLEWNEQSLALSHQNWQDTNSAKWIYTDQPDKDATQIQTWLSKLLRTSVSRSAAPDEDLSGLVPQFSMVINWEEQSKTVTYAKLPTDDSWWAKTPSTRGYVRISGQAMDSLMEDIPTLFPQ